MYIFLNQYLTFHDYISGICKSTHFHLRSIGRIRNLLIFDATALLIHALMTTRLDPCVLCVSQLVKRVLIHFLIDHLCMLLRHCECP